MTIGARCAARAAIALLWLGAACHWGTRGEDFVPTRSPVGARVALRLHGDPIDRDGELYAVDSTGITVRSERLIHVRWPAISIMDVEGLGRSYDVRSGGRGVNAEKRARLAVVSRFPQGLSGELLARVLVLVNQPAVDEVP